MTVTYITPDAELDDLIARNKAGTAQIEKLLNAEESIKEIPSAPFPWAVLTLGAGLGAAVVAVVAIATSLF